MALATRARKDEQNVVIEGCGGESLWLEQFPKIGAGPSLLSSGALAAASEEVSLSQPYLGSLKPLLTQAHPSPCKDLPHCPPKYF